MNLPSFEECEAAVKAGKPTALQLFVYDNEPAGEDDEFQFRSELAAAIDEAYERGRKSVPLKEHAF